MRISIRPAFTRLPDGRVLEPDPMGVVPVAVATPEGDVFSAGVLAKVDGLWKRARLVVSRDASTVTAEGMDQVHAALKRISGDGHPVVVLQLHPGYYGVYDGGVFPFARVMRTDEGWRMRHFDPHQSLLFDNPDSAIDAALEPR